MTEEKPAIRKRPEPGRAYLVALGHLNPGQTPETIKSLIKDRYPDVSVSDEFKLEHRYMRTEDLGSGIFCEDSDKAATPVTVLIA